MKSALNEKGISQIVKSLEKSNDKQELIYDTIVDFNPVLKSPIVYDIIDNAQAFLAITATALSDIAKGVESTFELLAGNKLQDEENRREMNALLAKIAAGGTGSGSAEVKAAKPPKDADKLQFSFGGAFLFSGAIGTVLGFLAEMVSGLGPLLTRIKTFSVAKFTKIVDPIIEFFSSIKLKVMNLFKGGKFAILDDIKNIFTFFKDTKLIGGSKGFFSIFTKGFDAITDVFKMLKSGFSWGMKFGRLIGQLAKKLFIPLTIIISLFETVIGAIDGFKKDGIVGAIKGGISGLLVSVVGGIVDLAKSAISWLLGALGFENAETFLDSFSISGLISEGVDGIVDSISQYFNYLMDMFSPAKFMEAFNTGGVNGLVLSIADSIFSVFRDTIANVLDFFGFRDTASMIDGLNFGELITNAVDGIKSFFTDMFDAVLAIFDGDWSKVGDILGKYANMAEDFIKNVLRAVLPKKDDSKLSKILGWAIPDDLYSYAGLNPKTGEDAKGDKQLNQAKAAGYSDFESYKESGFKFKGDDSDREKRAKAAGYNNWSEFVAADFKNKASDLSPNPSTIGATLRDASNATSNAPITINQMGGNVTNTTVSSVNNNTTSVDPLIGGSSLGMTAV